MRSKMSSDAEAWFLAQSPLTSSTGSVVRLANGSSITVKNLESSTSLRGKHITNACAVQESKEKNMAAKKKHVSVVKTKTKTVDQNDHPVTLTETVATTAKVAPKRCHLCSDGATGKALVKVTNAVRQEQWACQQHAAFYGRERNNQNRKFLPGNADLLGATAESGNSDALEHKHSDDEEKTVPAVRMRDKK